MKRSYSILLLSLLPAAAAFTGCQKLTEDPKASLTPGTYFKSQNDLDAALSAVYTELTPDYAFGFTSRMTSCFGSDDLTTDPALNKGNYRSFDELNGNSGASDGDLLNQWQGPWNTVYQANNVISNWQNVPGTSASAEQAKQQSAAQAYFLRAFSYYYLVRVFGPVPVISGAINVSDRPARDSVSKVYAQIVSDLNTAIGWLPASWPGQPGRVTQNAARALLADVYLTTTGWPLNQTGNYALAAAEADTVMLSGQFALVPDYATVFQTNNNSESIFGLQFNVTGGVPERSFGATATPLDESGLDGSGGWDDFYPEINFYLNRPLCIRSTETFYDTLKLQTNGHFAKVPWNSPLTHAGHPYYKKFRAGLVTNGSADGVSETDSTILSIQPSTNKTQDYIRYPMVLLDYAEASDMAGGGPTAGSYAAINLVRARAGEPPLVGGLSQTAFRDSVVTERAYEFAGESGVRWFDIVRLQILPQVIAARSPLENPITNSGNLQDKYLAPIPAGDLAADPNWLQNPGY